MRGRKPRAFALEAHDKSLLQHIARSRTLPWLQVQRSRTILALADGERVRTVAQLMQCDPSTIWRLCRRYEQVGLAGLLMEAPWTGHPDKISPSGTCANRVAGLPAAHRARAAHQLVGA